MKTCTKWFCIVVLAVCSTQSFAQGWVPVGTEWTYAEHNYLSNSNLPSKIIATEEIIDDGRLVTKLIVDPASGCAFQPDVIYAYSTPEKEVYFKFPEDTSYVKYYDFKLKPGDHFEVPITINGLNEEMRVFIDGVDTVSIFDEARIRIRGHILLNLFDFVAPPTFIWIEGIGDVQNSMFLAHTIHCIVTNSSVFGFICFEDPNDGIYNPHEIDCDSFFTSDTKELENDYPVRIYPNPVADMLYFETNEFDSWTAEFVHPSGQVIQTNQVKGNNVSVPDFMAPGIYFVRLYDKSGNHKVFKIIKN